ncbi:BrnA antitoxin family protein [Sphingomonas abietis]|uniref:BrnA antitoxin family protein n=1 Tax=Sphingomonas abietis TaxID=3012344 RepID=A0ABY7NKT1_9SPHN|nr:BrnA antitoxin family protein [Sphingomonas abietis]WBO22099.1 BrnA antitoxin family protein [Sphingomonas abietis]
MTEPKYTQADLDAVSDNPEWTAADFAEAKPFAEAFPELAQSKRGPQRKPTKVSTTIRLSPDVLDRFKAGGPGWQSRIDDALRKAVGLG